jgi:hypothetical protein
MRDITYKNKQWNIFNEFFWLSPEYIKELADKYNNTDIYNDVKQFGEERYVYKLLQDIKLSPKAQKVLDYAAKIVEKTFEYRNIVNDENPDFHINTWDAGWYQMKKALKSYSGSFDTLNSYYKILEADLRKGVFKFGFLNEW